MTKEEVLRIFSQFSSGQLSFEQFEEWVVSHLQVALDSGDQEVIRLMDEADGLLLQLGVGEVDDVAVLNGIDALVREAQTVRVSMSMGSPLSVTTISVSKHNVSTELPFRAEPLILAFE